jgi:hypothetical protein
MARVAPHRGTCRMRSDFGCSRVAYPHSLSASGVPPHLPENITPQSMGSVSESVPSTPRSTGRPIHSE